MSTELYIPPVRRTTNPTNGRFLKGNVPANKGKHWEEYLSEEAQSMCKKGWVNLRIYQPKKRPDNSEKWRKSVVGVLDNGRFKVFSHSEPAAAFCGGDRGNVNRCCRENQCHGSNTDHRYKGIRWYFESDLVWTSKIDKR